MNDDRIRARTPDASEAALFFVTHEAELVNQLPNDLGHGDRLLQIPETDAQLSCASASKDVLNLIDGLARWCDPSIVQRIRDEERRCSEYQLDQSGLIQLTSREMRRKPTNTSWMAGHNLRALLAAWEDLENDLRHRIEQGRIHLRGVQLAPEQRTEPEIIPGVWAADFQFSFSKGTIRAGKRRYGAISCWEDQDLGCVSQVEAKPSTTDGRSPVTDQASQQPVRPVNKPISFGVIAEGKRVVFADGPTLKGASAKLVWNCFQTSRLG